MGPGRPLDGFVVDCSMMKGAAWCSLRKKGYRIGIDNNVDSSSTVMIGSIHCHRGGPHRSLACVHNAQSDFVLSRGTLCVSDAMEWLLYSDNDR
jgi:hypothetical protein